MPKYIRDIVMLPFAREQNISQASRDFIRSSIHLTIATICTIAFSQLSVFFILCGFLGTFFISRPVFVIILGNYIIYDGISLVITCLAAGALREAGRGGILCIYGCCFLKKNCEQDYLPALLDPYINRFADSYADTLADLIYDRSDRPIFS